MIHPFQVPSSAIFELQELDRLTIWQTLFAVPLQCESCVKDISQALHQLPGNIFNIFYLPAYHVVRSNMTQPGILSVDADLAKQLVKIEGTGITIPHDHMEAATQLTRVILSSCSFRHSRCNPEYRKGCHLARKREPQ